MFTSAALRSVQPIAIIGDMVKGVFVTFSEPGIHSMNPVCANEVSASKMMRSVSETEKILIFMNSVYPVTVWGTEFFCV